MEMKLAQQLAYLEQTPLFSIFIDLRKAFDAMDRENVSRSLRTGALDLRPHVWFATSGSLLRWHVGLEDTTGGASRRTVGLHREDHFLPASST